MILQSDPIETEINSEDGRIVHRQAFENLPINDRRTIWLLCTLKGTWHRFGADVPKPFADSIMKMLQAGWVQGFALGHMHMDNFPQRVEVSALVVGNFQDALGDEMLKKVPAWRGPNGTRDWSHPGHEVTHIRLTAAGETAREHWARGQRIMPMISIIPSAALQSYQVTETAASDGSKSNPAPVAKSDAQSQELVPGAQRRPVGGTAPMDVAKSLGCSLDTLRKFVTQADVTSPARGEKNFRYTDDAVRKIAECMAANSGNRAQREAAKALLAKMNANG